MSSPPPRTPPGDPLDSAGPASPIDWLAATVPLLGAALAEYRAAVLMTPWYSAHDVMADLMPIMTPFRDHLKQSPWPPNVMREIAILTEAGIAIRQRAHVIATTGA